MVQHKKSGRSIKVSVLNVQNNQNRILGIIPAVHRIVCVVKEHTFVVPSVLCFGEFSVAYYVITKNFRTITSQVISRVWWWLKVRKQPAQGFENNSRMFWNLSKVLFYSGGLDLVTITVHSHKSSFLRLDRDLIQVFWPFFDIFSGYCSLLAFVSVSVDQHKKSGRSIKVAVWNVRNNQNRILGITHAAHRIVCIIKGHTFVVQSVLCFWEFLVTYNVISKNFRTVTITS